MDFELTGKLSNVETTATNLSTRFALSGVVLIPDVFSPGECEVIAAHVPTSPDGARSLLTQSWCVALGERLRNHPRLVPLVPEGFVAVQCTSFEKSAARNWLVPMHQDLSIPVAGRVDSSELGGWSQKEGTTFVQAPADVLEQLVAVRVHLDPCGEADGPLRVVPGSHRGGRLDGPGMERARRETAEVACVGGAGSVVVMRPLVLHASSKATGQGRRRVLHFVFGPRALPHGLRWSVEV